LEFNVNPDVVDIGSTDCFIIVGAIGSKIGADTLGISSIGSIGSTNTTTLERVFLLHNPVVLFRVWPGGQRLSFWVFLGGVIRGASFDVVSVEICVFSIVSKVEGRVSGFNIACVWVTGSQILVRVFLRNPFLHRGSLVASIYGFYKIAKNNK
jgi:hypothetical protein